MGHKIYSPHFPRFRLWIDRFWLKSGKVTQFPIESLQDLPRVAIEWELIRVALQLVECKYLTVFDRLMQHFDLSRAYTE
jgi:hypothetical protein